jgi:hybrid cluster-associated redox disulfide protein
MITAMSTPSDLLDPDANLTDVFKQWPQMIPIFIRHHMSCVGCSMTPFDTIKDVAFNYGLKLDEFIQELKTALPKSDL